MKGYSGSKELTMGRSRRESDSEEPAHLRNLSLEMPDKRTMILQYYSQVRAYLSVFGINSAYLDDAVQDTMIEAMSCMGNLRDPSKLKSWLLVIAKRIGLKYVVAEKSGNECSFEECVENGMETEFVSDRQLCSYMSRIDNEELARIINETLSEKEKKVIILYYVYEHKLKEIAEMIGETETNTRTLSARAKKKLKAKLEEGGYYER